MTTSTHIVGFVHGSTYLCPEHATEHHDNPAYMPVCHGDRDIGIVTCDVCQAPLYNETYEESMSIDLDALEQPPMHDDWYADEVDISFSL